MEKELNKKEEYCKLFKLYDKARLVNNLIMCSLGNPLLHLLVQTKIQKL